MGGCQGISEFLYTRYVESVMATERWVCGTIPSIELVSPRLHSRHYRWYTFLHHLFQGQIMWVPTSRAKVAGG